MSATVSRTTRRAPTQGARERFGLYLWTGVVLAVALAVVILSWHARGGTADPTDVAPGHQLSHTTVVLDSAILVFREGLETVLVLAAIVASFRGANSSFRRPVAAGSGMAIGAGVATWFGVIWLIGRFHGSELTIQAATGLPALLVLLLVMNWFFHKVYWTGWISHHNQRRRGLLPPIRRPTSAVLLLGLALLGFTSVYRECFEVVIFLQNLREIYGAGVVLEGVTIGLLFTAAVGVLTFALHQRLPYKRLLIITGVMLLFVLIVAVGEEVNEMQLAGWIGTTADQLAARSRDGWAHGSACSTTGRRSPASSWRSRWLSAPTSAQYLRVWRPRRQGRRAARVADQPPDAPADLVVGARPLSASSA